mmetsp:Transcript_13569/g.19555  ORF Transcript_13569/g.19555 Transcript_13569/m.19555 type:complete len:136 (+) Transcript_13569:61-468(+)
MSSSFVFLTIRRRPPNEIIETFFSHFDTQKQGRIGGERTDEGGSQPLVESPEAPLFGDFNKFRKVTSHNPGIIPGLDICFWHIEWHSERPAGHTGKAAAQKILQFLRNRGQMGPEHVAEQFVTSEEDGVEAAVAH